ncbi:MAG: CoA transferase, partial [Acidimicrobiales bacterium]|nr:CoA transferase [Acidimicrobiales bacterium]
LPPIALTDEITAVVAAFATLAAVHTGVGQVVDVNLYESLLQMMGPLPGAKALLDYDQPRLGSGIPYSVPRGTWRCADGAWVAVSTSAESVARRVMGLIGFGDRPDLVTFAGRIEARAEIDARMAEWCGARPLADVLADFERAEAAAAPIYDMAGAATDPHFVARGTTVEVDGVAMPGLLAHLSATPGAIRWAGRSLGADDPPEWDV